MNRPKGSATAFLPILSMEGLMRSRFLAGCRVGAAAGLLAAGPVTAFADDYPYSGLFWLAAESDGSGSLDSRCALSFLEQRTDGTWSVYHLDLEEFSWTKAVVYKVVSEGTCQFTPETKVESCMATMDKSFPEGEGKTVYDVVTTTAKDRIDTVMIEAANGWDAVMKDPTNPDVGFPLAYLRCPFSDEALKSRISDVPSTATPDELSALRFPSAELLANPDVALVVQALGGQ